MSFRQSSRNSELSLVYAWGSNLQGQLCLKEPNPSEKTHPKPCLSDLSSLFSISSLSCGENFVSFTTAEGHLYTMGSNKDGRLGTGSPERFSPLPDSSSCRPIRIDSLLTHFVLSVSCGLGHAIAIADSGRSVFSWGAGAFGQTGQGVFTPSSEPKSVLFANASGRRNQEGWQTFRAVSCGPYSTAIVSEEGKVYFCGDGMNGQLANGKNNRQCIATDSPYISEAMQSVAMGESHVLLLAKSGNLFACGSNSTGELGLGHRRSSRVPILVSDLKTERILSVSAGKFSAAVSNRGALFVWGSGTFGECFNPKKIESKDSLFVFCKVIGHNIGVVDDGGYVWTSGPNEYGQLGTGDFLSSDSLNLNSEIQEIHCSTVQIGNGFMMAVGTLREGFGSEDQLEEVEIEEIGTLPDDFQTESPENYNRTMMNLPQQANVSGREHGMISKDGTRSLVSFTQQSQNNYLSRYHTETKTREEEYKTLWLLWESRKDFLAIKCENLEEKLDLLKKNNDHLSRQLENAQQMINYLGNENKNKDKEIVSLKDKISGFENALDESNKRNDTLLRLLQEEMTIRKANLLPSSGNTGKKSSKMAYSLIGTSGKESIQEENDEEAKFSEKGDHKNSSLMEASDSSYCSEKKPIGSNFKLATSNSRNSIVQCISIQPESLTSSRIGEKSAREEIADVNSKKRMLEEKLKKFESKLKY